LAVCINWEQIEDEAVAFFIFFSDLLVALVGNFMFISKRILGELKAYLRKKKDMVDIPIQPSQNTNQRNRIRITHTPCSVQIVNQTIIT
jgi:hypothetical protein